MTVTVCIHYWCKKKTTFCTLILCPFAERVSKTSEFHVCLWVCVCVCVVGAGGSLEYLQCRMTPTLLHFMFIPLLFQLLSYGSGLGFNRVWLGMKTVDIDVLLLMLGERLLVLLILWAVAVSHTLLIRLSYGSSLPVSSGPLSWGAGRFVKALSVPMEMIIGFELILFVRGIMSVNVYYVQPNFTFWSERHFISTCNILL